MRLDLLLVEWGYAPSRTKAQELIKHGDVELQVDGEWTVVLTASLKSSKTQKDQVRIRSLEILQYVSRGGLKLRAALEQLKWSVKDVIALDVGLSTGGFSDCLFQSGAAKIVGIDVGSGQLSPKLKSDTRLVSFEKINAKYLSMYPEVIDAIGEVNFCVIDVSFISLEKILPEIVRFLPPHRLLALIKPQFELSPEALNKQGIVKSDAEREQAINRVRGAVTALGYEIKSVFPCAWKGGDGNQEFFLAATRR
jgi:23S rRNA (cytidine1920-2'-O)/16S rRNA (cytidine1409-2'-O)-methyltransferase